MPTIKDVAREAGVGIATISRVINNSGYVGKATREKVERVIQELGYKPNEIARSMIRQKNGIVAFIIPNSTHLFFGELVYYVEQELYEYGYKLLLCNSSQKIEKEISYLEMLENNRVDACILLTNNDIEGHLRKDLPIISFDRRFEGVPFVASDNYRGGELAAEHLLKQGCNHLMFIGDDAQGETVKVNTEVSKRRKGFVDFAAKANAESIINIEYPLGDYIRISDSVLEEICKYPEVDGIFCISDAVAADVILKLQSIGKRVPDDVKVIGFDGGRSFINLGMSMTSIEQDPSAIAKAIGEMIESYYRNKTVENRILPVTLTKGESA